MFYLIQYLCYFSCLFKCMSSENVPPMSGFYTDGLDQVLDKIEIVYPERISKDGSFVSYYLPHYYNLEQSESRPRRTESGSEESNNDAIHFFVPIEGEKHHLELFPNSNFMAPGLIIERRDARDVENVNKAKISQISQRQCHYNGKIVGKPNSRAALSTCYGLAGYIQLPAGEEYLIEPVKDSKPTYDKEHPHIMYKRSGMKDKHGNSNCLTKGTAKEALGERMEWESIFGGQVRKEFSGVDLNELMREYSAKQQQDSSKEENPTINTQNYQMNSAIDPQMNSQMDSKMNSQMDPQMNSKMNSQMDPQMDPQMNPQMNPPMNPQMNPQMGVGGEFPSNDKSGNNNENILEEDKLKAIKTPQNSYPQYETILEDNVQPKNDVPISFEKNTAGKMDFGNKLKQKPLKEELGSIKLPDALKQATGQSLDNENFLNKPGITAHNKLLHESVFEHRRVKRELSKAYNNINSESNKLSNVDLNHIDKEESCNNDLKNDKNLEKNKCGSTNEVSSHETSQDFEKKASMSSSELDNAAKCKQMFKTKRDAQNDQVYHSLNTKVAANIADNMMNSKETSKEGNNEDTFEIPKNGYYKQTKPLIVQNLNNAETNQLYDKAAYKQSEAANKHMTNQMSVSGEKINERFLLNNFENDVKRDIHLDTSEKSWQIGDNNEKSNSAGKPGKINYKEGYSVETNNKYVDDMSSLDNKNIQNFLDKDKKKEGKVSKLSKGDNCNDDKIMVSALESVVRDMDKTKVKKDVIESLIHSPNKNLGRQQIYSKLPLDLKDEKYLTFDQSNMKNIGDAEDKDGNSRNFDGSLKLNPGIMKENKAHLEEVDEPIHRSSIYGKRPTENQVDEIVIRINTQDGTISDVKQNYESDNKSFRKDSSVDPVMNSRITGSKGLPLDNEHNIEPSKKDFKINEMEKNKRGIDSKLGKEVKEKPDKTDQVNSEGYQENSLQDFDIIVESEQKVNEENDGHSSKNKAKRDDNTIHLVIETEPEVKSAETHNSESPGSNLFCQGRNCLEIKPVLLNDTKAAVSPTSNNTNVETSKEKVIEKRDLGDEEVCSETTTQKPLMCFDFYNKVFNLELMITVDFKVVKLHDDDDIENFILTVMNMVSSNFNDKTIGINFNVVLVRLILLTTCIKELDSDRFNPEELLENFCTWQVLVNPGRDDHPHHHDLAIFVTRMEKCEGQVMGVTYMTSVCRPDKACLVCVDEGLLLANTITHQIGHSLGADHDDGQHSGCTPTMPDGTSFHMSPTISETSSAWSVCSSDAITQFVKTQGSWCLLDIPLVKSYNFPIMLPGQIYSAAQQCRLNFHMTAIPCSVGLFCSKLYCQITDKLCATKGDPPADGTFCAANMWCFHKQCVHIGRRPGAINGEWGPWTEWSLCTRSCGGGVSSSFRICNNPKPENGGRFCIGERIRHKICATKPCQGFTDSFRDLQCKRTEDRPFRGKIHNWVQYQSLFINIECALVCQNRKGDVVMRSPIVADGTPCKSGTRNVCIQGTCRSVGCDWTIDSTAKEDACGICHGNGTECKIVQGVFDEAITKKGLIEFLRIPKESGMVFVREVAPSDNLIVVSGSINRAFYLNGLGSDDSMAGDVAFGLVHGVYEKRGGMERVFIRGPTKEELIFYILFRESNKGVHYQYSTPEYDPTYIPRYLWQYLDWDACTDPCSGGSQRARAKCVEDRGGMVDDKYCTESSRPIDIIRPCNDFPCQAKWWVSVWSDCICTGSSSVMFRSVLCMRANDESGTRVEVVKESECSLSKKPPTQKLCNVTDDDTDCAKRSISDYTMFGTHRDLRRAVNPRLAFSQAESDGPHSQDAELLHDSTNNRNLNENKNLKKSSKPTSNKNINMKASVNKLNKPKLLDKDQTEKKKISPIKTKEGENSRPTELAKNEGSIENKVNAKNEVLPLVLNKGKQIAKLNSKNSPAIIEEKSKQDESDLGSQESDTGEKCESSTTNGTCPTETDTPEPTTTCKQTCAIQPHRKTTCCKTTPHRKYFVKTTIETTTVRPVAVKMDELNVHNFALTVVPLDFSGKRKILPQSDPEFINFGAVGQFGVGDEANATVVFGQEALDLLEFARSNASEEPVILHDDIHN